MAVPYTFGTATAAIPLSQLDSNFATAITIGNTAVQLGNTVTTLNNMTLANVTISSGTVTITNVAVTTANVSGTANISTLVVTANASVAGNVTVSGNTVVTGNVTSATHILTGGTANGVVYLDTTKALTTGSALVFDGTNLGVGTSSPANKLDVSGTVRSTTQTAPSSGAGMELFYDSSGNVGYLISYNRSTSAYKQINFGASLYNFGIAGSTAMTLDASGNLLIGGTSNAAGARLISENASGNQLGLRYTSVATWYNSVDSSGNYIWTKDGANIARIDSNGNLLVGQGGTGFSNSNSITIEPGSGAYSVYNHASGSASGNKYIWFAYGASGIGSITQNGTTGVLYNLTSDYRLKNNQEALTGAKDFIMALKPKKWQWWDGSGEGVGFIAHEFMEVAKHSGNGEKDAVDADGKPVYQSIQPSSSEVMANLVAFVQELKAEIDSLKSQLNGA